MFDYNTVEELYNIISSINRKYYLLLCANMLYIEEYQSKNLIAFQLALRDIHSHLAMIFNIEDVLDQANKEKVNKHLSEYTVHFEQALIDSFIKIVEIKKRYLLSIVRSKDKAAIEAQLALKISELRIMEIDNENKPQRYQELINFIDATTDKFITKI